jgi:adenylate cyclase
MKRRLAAILATDVVGYSTLMHADEAGTLAALRAHRQELFDPETERHGGRIVKLMGDGALVEFPSVVDAVECALAIQKALINSGGPISLRIGINLGDVIYDGDDIYGDGVNVAARLEALAKPGGICISSIVQESIGNRVAAKFGDAGQHEVKGLPQPIRVWHWPPEEELKAAANQTASFQKPSIAVLPFVNMSRDPEQEYFSDGITEDILTELSRFRFLSVIARNSSFRYKGQATKGQDVGRELGVRYVLEGSVRKAGERVRITAQLIDANTGGHVWADRYDGELADVFELQDSITASVVGAVQPGIFSAEMDRAGRKRPSNLDAYDLYLRGWWNYFRLTREGMFEARKLLSLAIELDSGFAAAHTALASAHLYEFGRFWSNDPHRSLTEAVQAAQRAISLDPNDAEPHWILSLSLVFDRRYGLSLSEADRAVELNPNLAVAYCARSFAHTFGGQPEDGVKDAMKAIQFSPNDPFRFGFLNILTISQYASRNYEGAAEAATKLTGLAPQHPFGYFNLAAACGRLGQLQEAQHALQEGMRLHPNFSKEFIGALWPFKHASDLEHLLEGLHEVGLAK